MKRSIFATIAALALLASLMGLAMASPSETTSELVKTDSSVPDATVPTTAREADHDGATSTSSTLEDDDDEETTSTILDDGDDSTSSTIDVEGEADDTTSTTIDDDDDTTSTTTDDNDDGTTPATIDDDDTVADQVLSREIPGVGTVTVEVRSGRLELVSVSAPGWDIAVEAESAEIEVTFLSESSEVEFGAELEAGAVKIEIENHSS